MGAVLAAVRGRFLSHHRPGRLVNNPLPPKPAILDERLGGTLPLFAGRKYVSSCRRTRPIEGRLEKLRLGLKLTQTRHPPVILVANIRIENYSSQRMRWPIAHIALRQKHRTTRRTFQTARPGAPSGPTQKSGLFARGIAESFPA
jgi:hypothetical protein